MEPQASCSFQLSAFSKELSQIEGRDAVTQLEAAARHAAGAKPPLELLAEDLRAAHTALAAITGEFTADDLLGAIFSRFCIGK